MRFTPNLVVGIVITLFGLALLLERMNVMEIRQLLQLWPVLLTIFGVSIIVQALRGNRDDAAGSGAAQARPIIGPGLVLLIVFGSLMASRADSRRFVAGGGTTDPTLSLVGVMSDDARTSMSSAFQRAEMTSVMGRTRLDLRQATLTPNGEAVVDVLGVMGGVVLTVPRTWEIDVQATAIMGRIEDRRDWPPDAQASRRERRLRAAETARGDAESVPPSSAGAGTTPDAAAVPPGPRPRLVLRGVVVAGGIVIRS